VENIKKLLQSHGIRPSLHRIKILQYVLHSHDHPTADTVYADLHPQIPTLSKTTVYNALNLFADHNLVTAMRVGAEQRFDGTVGPHAHFLCSRCLRIYDVSLSANLDDMAPAGFQVDQAMVLFRGVCRGCLGASAPPQ